MDGTILTPAAARRYPGEAVEVRALADGQPLLIRPLAARDAELLQDFVRDLSVYRRSMAFAAVVFEHGHKRMIGEARYAPALDGSGAAVRLFAAPASRRRLADARRTHDRFARDAHLTA